MLDLIIITNDAVTNPSACFDNQTGDVDKQLDKFFKLHAQNGETQMMVCMASTYRTMPSNPKPVMQ